MRTIATAIRPSSLPAHIKNFVTPAGHAALQAELRQLRQEERPKVVEVVSWAASNGDRSENADYHYGKKRLREIDRRVRYLTKRLESAVLVDPKQQQALRQVFFGATVTYARADGGEHTVTLVGVDEADLSTRQDQLAVAGCAGIAQGERQRQRAAAHAVRCRTHRDRGDPLRLAPAAPSANHGVAGSRRRSRPDARAID